MPQVWRIADNVAHRFRQFGKTSAPTISITADPSQSNILSATVDGGVTLWSASTFEPIYKMKLPKVAHDPFFFGPTRFCLHMEAQVRREEGAVAGPEVSWGRAGV